jgi:glycerol transport system ATP-binding protein
MTLTLGGVTRIVGGETHIAEVNLELEPGSLNLLLGPTLWGKTSLMRLMAGLDRPTEGRVLVDGRDLTGNSVRKREVAMVCQQFINYPSFTMSKTVSLKKTHVGLTPIRDNDIHHESFTERAPKLGGLVEFYRSPARVARRGV